MLAYDVVSLASQLGIKFKKQKRVVGFCEVCSVFLTSLL